MVDPNVAYTKQRDIKERLHTYVKSIKQWLTKTTLPIIIVENSGYIFTELNELIHQYKDRIEFISFNENENSAFNKLYEFLIEKNKNHKDKLIKNKNGKGLHEIFAIQYAVHHSKLIKKCTHIIKVTGRYFIPNFEEYVKTIPYSCKAIRQKDHDRCEIVGCRKDMTDIVFDCDLYNKKGIFDEHIENVYKIRIDNIMPSITLPMFPIEPTPRGGYAEKYKYL